MLPTIADRLGVRGAGHRPVADRLRAHLAERQLLLVLDNCEQVLDAAPILPPCSRPHPGYAFWRQVARGWR